MLALVGATALWLGLPDAAPRSGWLLALPVLVLLLVAPLPSGGCSASPLPSGAAATC